LWCMCVHVSNQVEGQQQDGLNMGDKSEWEMKEHW
jgi:hypothetical protein